MRRWIDALWPAALLVLFLGTFRTTAHESVSDQSSSICGALHTSDLATLERCLALDTQNVELMTDIGDQYAISGNTDRAEAMYGAPSRSIRATAMSSFDSVSCC